MPWNNTVSSFQSAVTPRSCFVVGATGEVGKALVKQLLCSSAFERVVVLVRRPLNYTGPNKDILEEAIVEDFDGLETDGNAEKVRNCQFGFCALGTTRAKAGTAVPLRYS
jgi:oxidoreductase